MHSEQYKYLPVSLSLLQLTYKKTPKEGFTFIQYYGLYLLSKTIKFNSEDLISYTINVFVGKENASKNLKTFLNELDGSNGIELQDQILKLMNDSTDFLNYLKRDYRLKVAAFEFFGKSIKNFDSDVIPKVAEAMKFVEEFEKKFRKDSIVSIKTDQITDFKNKVDPYEFDLFRAYIAIKSAIGKKKWRGVTNSEIIGRMIGCKNAEAFKYYQNNPAFRPTIEKFSKRYHIEKLVDFLRERKFIIYRKMKGSPRLYSTYKKRQKLKTV